MTKQAQAVPPMRIEQVPIGSLTPSPRNFRHHPPRQLEELQTSLREYGWARNVVVSSDNVILAGHGIVEAARLNGHTEVPVLRLALRGDDPKAEKFLVLENTVSRLAEDDDTQLAALLADVQRTEGLAGTGYDEADLDSMLGSMDGHAWDPNAGAQRATGKDLARRWFVGFVLEQEAKQALGDVLAEEALGNEKPHETLARLITERVVRKH